MLHDFTRFSGFCRIINNLSYGSPTDSLKLKDVMHKFKERDLRQSWVTPQTIRERINEIFDLPKDISYSDGIDVISLIRDQHKLITQASVSSLTGVKYTSLYKTPDHQVLHDSPTLKLISIPHISSGRVLQVQTNPLTQTWSLMFGLKQMDLSKLWIPETLTDVGLILYLISRLALCQGIYSSDRTGIYSTLSSLNVRISDIHRAEDNTIRSAQCHYLLPVGVQSHQCLNCSRLQFSLRTS